MNIESILKHLLAAGVVFLNTSLFAQENPQPPSVFAASFEEDEGYAANKSLLNQKNWSISSADRNNAEVKKGGLSGIQPPVGEYLAKVTMGNVHLHRVLTEEPLRERVISKGFAAVNLSEIRPASARFFLSGAHPDQRFKGASYGISEENDKLVITYRDKEEHQVLSTKKPITEGIFYRFECDVDLQNGTYALKVYDHENDELIGEVSGVQLRGDLKKINFLMLQGSTGTCFDGISVSGN